MFGGNFITPSSCTDVKPGEEARVEASDGTAEAPLCKAGPEEDVLRLLPGRTIAWLWPNVGVFESVSPNGPGSCEECALGSSGSGVAAHSKPEPSGSFVGFVAERAIAPAACPLFSGDAQVDAQTSQMS